MLLYTGDALKFGENMYRRKLKRKPKQTKQNKSYILPIEVFSLS